MKKFWISSLLITLGLVALFLLLLYTCGIYTNPAGRLCAIAITALLIIQLIVDLFYNLIRSRHHTLKTSMLSLLSTVFSVLAILYTWNCVFIRC